MLVLDANVVLPATLAEEGFRRYDGEELVGPPLLWSECRSALHVAVGRGRVPRDEAVAALEVLEDGPVRLRTHPRLTQETWRIADQLGWERTYGAEYVALASLLGCRLVTLDARLRRGADRLGFVVLPREL